MSQQPKWVLEKRLRELTGLSHEQVRLRRAQWVEGRQWKYGPDKTIWYNLEEIERWVENGIAA
ncbi:excisionase family protein [Marinobacter nauticus]|uniref:excisionase family protein n=1 Tax=Marinobacter nauticus TaxID=2743 RepID=UPI001D189212|nr:excisionase family protein [Marinobacter nauticus]MCC4269154.1 excisionase family protein [Marinobacter nauticus]